MKIVSARRFGLWTKLAQQWAKRQLDRVVALLSDAIKVEVRQVAGDCVIPDFIETGLPAETVSGFCAIYNDGDLIVEDLDVIGGQAPQYKVGDIIKPTSYTEEDYTLVVAKTVTDEAQGYEQGLWIDDENILHGVTEEIYWQPNHYYRVTGIHDVYNQYGTSVVIRIFTYEEVTTATITDVGKQLSDKIEKAKPDLSPVAKDATVAKEAQATLNKQEILARIGKSFATANANVLTLCMVTLKQMEDLFVKTNNGDTRFSIATDQSDFYLSFSSDSPQAIANQLIYDDSVVIYDNEVIFDKIVITFPVGWTIAEVYLEGVDGNLLNEGDAWRLAEIGRLVRNIDFTPINIKLDEIIGAFPQEPDIADIDQMFETTTEEGQILIQSGLIDNDGAMPIRVFKAITGLTPVN